MFMRALFSLGKISSLFGIEAYRFLFYHTKGTDDAEWHLAHLHQCRHGSKLTLIEKVEEGGMYHIVEMMSQGYLIASQRLSFVEHHFTTVP